mmetsp:Transcript_52489/g.139760  ORF Transcript_52489/g.139760 Transcript_52489/m.139760 type:complete len:294 (+) Transcript_52489:1270-2151(+)
MPITQRTAMASTSSSLGRRPLWMFLSKAPMLSLRRMSLRSLRPALAVGETRPTATSARPHEHKRPDTSPSKTTRSSSPGTRQVVQRSKATFIAFSNRSRALGGADTPRKTLTAGANVDTTVRRGNAQMSKAGASRASLRKFEQWKVAIKSASSFPPATTVSCVAMPTRARCNTFTTSTSLHLLSRQTVFKSRQARFRSFGMSSWSATSRSSRHSADTSAEQAKAACNQTSVALPPAGVLAAELYASSLTQLLKPSVDKFETFTPPADISGTCWATARSEETTAVTTAASGDSR